MSSPKSPSQNPLVNDLYTAIANARGTTTKARALIKTPKKPISPRRKEPTAQRNINDVEHFESLLYDLAVITRLLSENPSRFHYAHVSLLEEVLVVWNRLRTTAFQQPPPTAFPPNRSWSATKRQTPPKSASSSQGSPLINNGLRTRSSFDSHSASSPPRWRFAAGDIRAPINFLNNLQEFPIHIHKLEKKVFVPHVPNYNFIGRILGPRGISARQIEADTNCKILIRGIGSVKDPVEEKRLIGQPGYEHLSEDLHVHILTEGPDLADCQRRMDRSVSIIESLLTPEYDEYKKAQLLQLAIINGTYRPYSKKKKQQQKETSA